MARTPAPLPPWVPAVIGALLVAAVGWQLVGARVGDGRWFGRSATAVPPGPPAPHDPPARGWSNAPPRVSVRSEVLGRPSMLRFAFDPATPGRVVTCESESRDGGRTWHRLGETPGQPPIARDTSPPSVPVVGPDGGVLCGETILPGGPGAAAAAGEIQAAVGRARAWAADGRGVVYASLAEGSRRPHLAWADPDLGQWHAVPVPGEPQAIAVAGERAWVAAEMLGRGRRDDWDWTPWPARMRVEGLTVDGDTVVAWGTGEIGADRGALAISRDGGATLALGGIDRMRVIWAALDPHRPSQLLVLGEDGTLARAWID